MGGPDHLGPFLRFVGEELAELGWRERERRAAEIGKARLDFGISEGNRDLAVELIDDRRWGIPRRADTEPVAGLVAQARMRSRSGRPAAPPTVLRWSPRARAACRS